VRLKAKSCPHAQDVAHGFGKEEGGGRGKEAGHVEWPALWPCQLLAPCNLFAKGLVSLPGCLRFIATVLLQVVQRLTYETKLTFFAAGAVANLMTDLCDRQQSRHYLSSISVISQGT
jgi:hypothetical protein